MTIKDLYYSKYAQDWYRPKVIQKIYLKCIFSPVIAIKLVKAAIKTKLDLCSDSEFVWLFHEMAKNGYGDIVLDYLISEIELKHKIRKLFN